MNSYYHYYDNVKKTRFVYLITVAFVIKWDFKELAHSSDNTICLNCQKHFHLIAVAVVRVKGSPQLAGGLIDLHGRVLVAV